ncbi:hypothetical protein GCM10018793_47660 [Streptomyces sulfonofaciens]|uniref:Uncharacterized protein n=1 Tax=Streptomyces sulfonofaciens TaxID=68272 RepID=A0A919L4U6_9ACTN|nr:hypothetical protein GCM10018793_47660 [Streptomyces sulfonofaciens]
MVGHALVHNASATTAPAVQKPARFPREGMGGLRKVAEGGRDRCRRRELDGWISLGNLAGLDSFAQLNARLAA